MQTRRGRWTVAALAALMVSGVLAGSVSAGSPDRQTATAAPVLDPAFERLFTEVAAGDEVAVLVHGTTLDDARRAVASAGLRPLDEWPPIDAVLAAGVPSAVRRVATEAGVQLVEADLPVEHFLDSTHEASGAEDARHPRSGLLLPKGIPYDGTGVTIAINDTGIDTRNPMFHQDGVSKVVRKLRLACPHLDGTCRDWIDDPTNDPYGHGTMVAGVAAGHERTTLAGTTVRGVAPGASLVSLAEETAAPFAHVSGLLWVLEHHADPCGDGSCPPIRVVTNTWGHISEYTPGGTTYNPESAATKLSSALVDAGVLVTWSVGNEGSRGDGHVQSWTVSHSTNPKPGVMGAANYRDGNSGSRHGSIEPGSSKGLRSDPTTYPDIAAPATQVSTSCVPGTIWWVASGPKERNDPWYCEAGGTSLASPYIGGVAALLFQADPSLTPGDVEHVLERTARKVSAPPDEVPDPRHPGRTTAYDAGHGLVDVAAALADVLGRRTRRSYECAAQGDLTDPAGDNNSIGGLRLGELSALTAAADANGVSVRPSAEDGSVRLSVHFVDLDDGAAGRRDVVRFGFAFAGRGWMVQLQRVGGLAPTATVFEEASGATVDGAVATGFDAATDEAWVVLPADLPTRWDPRLPAFAEGSVLGAVEVTTNFLYGLSSSSDDLAGSCLVLDSDGRKGQDRRSR